MPSIPWTNTGPVDPDHRYLIMATRSFVTHRFRLVSTASATRQLWSGISEVDGLVGYSLNADLVHSSLATLTAWRDEASLGAFVRGESHTAVVVRTRRWMLGSTFASWTTAAAELPPRWDEAARRLDAARRPGGW